ncbi:methylmalonyl Co-A mutase-associated GTPase MeaB [Halobacteriales archaeon SW_7_71_33]|nr:MAG: methylmalonyl Co-A mutase-associated GTPase MeaB [Halobacteriales archaeon SW_7_71_33]
MSVDPEALYEGLLDGDHRALARTITAVENRSPGYRDLVSRLYEHTGQASIVGVTGSPGSGKSTLVDKLALAYREQGDTVGVIAVDPSSPYTGGAVLGDRIRMASNVGDMDVFVRSMSARGRLGGLSTATADAVKALDAFGKDHIVVETVGAGQNEIDIVRTADTVAVLVPPGSGDDVQTLKAGILEIADVFVVNKADKDGADRTVQELREMVSLRDDGPSLVDSGHHGPDAHGDAGSDAHGHSHGRGHDRDQGHGPGRERGHGSARARADDNGDEGDGGAATDDEGDDGDATGDKEEGGGGEEDEPAVWTPRIVETVATRGEGVDELIALFDEHDEHLERTGGLEEQTRERYASEIRTLLREDAAELLEAEIDRRGGMTTLVEAVTADETDPYTLVDEILAPVEEYVERRHDEPVTPEE